MDDGSHVILVAQLLTLSSIVLIRVFVGVTFCFLVLEFIISALFIILLLKLLQIINIFLKKSF